MEVLPQICPCVATKEKRCHQIPSDVVTILLIETTVTTDDDHSLCISPPTSSWIEFQMLLLLFL